MFVPTRERAVTLFDDPITRSDGFIYWLARFVGWAQGWPPEFFVSIVAGWAYYAYALATGRDKTTTRGKLLGGLMIAGVVGWTSYKLIHEWTNLSVDACVALGTILGASGVTGYKTLLARAYDIIEK